MSARTGVRGDHPPGDELQADDVHGDGTTARSRLAHRWRRIRLLVGVLAAAVLVAVLSVLALGSPGVGALDPDGAQPDGARALAQVLEDRGVDVRRHGRVAEALEDGGSGSTLVVVDADVLGEEALETLARDGADLVLVEPGPEVLEVLAPGLEAGSSGAASAVTDAGCSDPDAVVAGRASGGGGVVRASGAPREGAAPPVICFGGAYAVVDTGSRDVRVIAQPEVLQNETIDEHGNAALALRAVGRHPQVAWLMASPLDADAPAEDATDLLPPWVGGLALHLVLLFVVVAVWRGRRFGPLVTEPLPVVVRSAETAEGRANLYRRAKAYDRAAWVLRAATLRRAAHRLGLPAAAEAGTVVAACAAASGRDERRLGELLTGSPPPDAAGLVGLADELDRLEADLAGASLARTTDPQDQHGSTHHSPQAARLPESEST